MLKTLFGNKILLYHKFAQHKQNHKMKATVKTYVTEGYKKDGKKVLPVIIIKATDLTQKQRLEAYETIQMFHAAPLTFKTETI